MDLTFKNLKCPSCGELLQSGSTTVGHGVSMVKRCTSCEFWMVIAIPPRNVEEVNVKWGKEKVES